MEMEETMDIKNMTVAEAQTALQALGFKISFTTGGRVQKGDLQVLIMDRRGLDGAPWAVSVYRGESAHLVRRINVRR